MGVIAMAWRSLRQRPVSNSLTLLGVAMGVALVSAVLLLEYEARSAYGRTATGIEILVGGNKGSRIEVLLGTLFHVGRAPGRVDWSYCEEIAADPRVKWTAPFAVGDRHQGLPVVGTSDRFLKEFGLGEFGETERSAVLGAEAARRTGLSFGDRFVASHTGIDADPTHADEPFTVTDVAAPTGTAHDRVVWVRLDDFWHLDGHDRGGRAVSALLVKTVSGSPLVVEPLIRQINDGNEAQAIRPMQVVGELFALIGNAQRILTLVAWLVVAVAAILVAVSLHNSLASRREEIWILRALGAGRGRIFATVLAEAAILTGGGALIGLVLAHGGAAIVAPALEQRAGVQIGAPGLLFPDELLLVLGLTAVGCLAGLVPAVAAYRNEVGRGLR